MVQVDIRPCRIDDIPHLDSDLPGDGVGLHHARFLRQEAGGLTYLTAWTGGRVAGHVVVRWQGSVHDGVQAVFSDAPEIRRLVVRDDLRGRGIGSRLLARAEGLIVERGYMAAGLAVNVQNFGALRLYERAGYEDWQRGTFVSRWTRINEAGQACEWQHTVTYLVKDLRVRTRVGAVA